MNVDNPVMLSKVLGMAESGQLAEDIGKTLAEENYLHDLEKLGEYESDKIEYFPNEIKLIAQALCFRVGNIDDCLLYTSPSPRDRTRSRMPSSA